MRIVLDLQGTQASNRFRGIGRYSFSFAKALIQQAGEHEIYIVLNGLFPESVDFIQTELSTLLSRQQIHVWQSLAPVDYANSENLWRRQTAEYIREAAIIQLKPDFIVVSSLFEGYGNNAVTTVGGLSHNIPTAVILYDLIPLVLPNIFDTETENKWYQEKLNNLRRADLLLAISDASKHDVIKYLEFTESKVVNISAAISPEFKVISFLEEEEDKIRYQYGLNRPFVMYTGGIVYHHKNMKGLIRAYAQLPKEVRLNHQLALVCSIDYIPNRILLENIIKEAGLEADEVVMTGYVPDEDMPKLYNLCKLFVFPSLIEGFGLPILEAMACGCAVISSNTSSMPEVTGHKDALFDPYQENSITHKMLEALTNDDFLKTLKAHGSLQIHDFSWDKTAQKALQAMEIQHQAKHALPQIIPASARPKLAFISPLPPERSGISDYSAELLPALYRFYDIEVIIEQNIVENDWIQNHCPIRDVEWFRKKGKENYYDRVLYHFGNSLFHAHMFSLIEEIPGVVVLHDFFLSGVVSYKKGFSHGSWDAALYYSHGYKALRHFFHNHDDMNVAWHYPVNFDLLQKAKGFIVHTENSKRLVDSWYGEGSSQDWSVIPLLRSESRLEDKIKARELLKLNQDDFIVCSFGYLARTKLNHRLVRAWDNSLLAANKKGRLIFVGDSEQDDYHVKFQSLIHASHAVNTIVVTGWNDSTSYHQYLAAADVAVQLRTLSRGETSAAILDCMNYGLPIIVNAHGSMVDLPDDCVIKLPDQFDDETLSQALNKLWHDNEYRTSLGQKSMRYIRTVHDPDLCAEKYRTFIEKIYSRPELNHLLFEAIAKISTNPMDEHVQKLAHVISQSVYPKSAQRTLCVDITALMHEKEGYDHSTIVARDMLRELLMNPPDHLRIEPIYRVFDSRYYYARHFTLAFLECPSRTVHDEPVEFLRNDIFLGLLKDKEHVIADAEFYHELRRTGVYTGFIIYDLLSQGNVDLPTNLLIPWFYYFNDTAPDKLALAINKWLSFLK